MHNGTQDGSTGYRNPTRVARSAARSKGGYQLRNAVRRCVDWMAAHNGRPGEIGNAIVISGSPRSGTTWLMEMLCEVPGVRTVFEPLHPARFAILESLGMPPRAFLRPGQPCPELERHLDRVLRGQAVSLQPHYPLDARTLWRQLTARSIVAKFVNGNRLLPWMDGFFATRAVFLVLRHPCATIASQLQAGFFGYRNDVETEIARGNVNALRAVVLAELRLVPELCANGDLVRRAERAATVEELLAIEWAADQFVPLSASPRTPWHVHAYETLVSDPHTELQAVFGALGEKFPPRAMAAVRTPSATALQGHISATDQKAKWRRQLSNDQVRRIFDAIGSAGMSLYSEDAAPDSTALRRVQERLGATARRGTGLEG